MLFIIIFALAGCAQGKPQASNTASPSPAASQSAVNSAETAAPVLPDCAPEEFNSVGAEAAYLLSGGRFAEQGGFMYYFAGGETPGLYKQGEEESLIIQDERLKEASYLNIIGTRLYFISDGKACCVYTDSTGFEELFEARALLALEDAVYYIDGEGLKKYDASAGSVLIMEGDFSQLFMQFGQLFITQSNAVYGYDLLTCSDEANEAETVLEGCAFLLSDGQTLYAETSSGIYTVNQELTPAANEKLSFDLVPAAAAAYDGRIYYCDRREKDSIYSVGMDGDRTLFFNRPAEFIWAYSGRLIYQSNGVLMSVALDGMDNRLLSEGLNGLMAESKLPGAPSIEGIGNQALEAGQEIEISLLLDGQAPEEKGLSVQQAFEGLRIVNTDNLIARLVYNDGKLYIETLSEGTTVMRLETAEQSVEYLIRVIEA